MKGIGIGKYRDQRKIYKDGSRSLSIDHPGLVNFPLSRMDIMFWLNIVQQGEPLDLIRNNTRISNFNYVYNDVTLFHYFADNSEVIDMIYDKFKTALNENKLKDNEKNTPLTLLYLDPKGQTALDLAL